MLADDADFTQDVRRKVITKWKWHNPYVAGLLAFIHPIGMLFTSVPAFCLYLAVWTAVWVWWPNRPLGTGIALGLVFGIYAYYNTRWKNAAMEKWKYGLPGTGTQNPKHLNPPSQGGPFMFSIFKSRRNKWRDEAKKLFDVYIVSLKGLDPDEIGGGLDLAKHVKSTMMEKLPPGEIHIRQAFSDPFGLPEGDSLMVMEDWHTRMRSAERGEEAEVGALTIWWLSLAAATFAELRIYGKEMWAELERGFPYSESFDPEMDIPQRLRKFQE